MLCRPLLRHWRPSGEAAGNRPGARECQGNANAAAAAPRGVAVGAEFQVIAGLGGRVSAIAGGNPLSHLEPYAGRILLTQ